MLCLFLVEWTLLIIFQPGDMLSPLGEILLLHKLKMAAVEIFILK